MNINELKKELTALTESMEGSVMGVDYAATTAQESIYKALLIQIEKFEIENGRFLKGQPYAKRIAIIQREMERIIGDIYAPKVSEYLSFYYDVEERSLSMQKAYNDIEADMKLLSPARQTIYTQAQYYMTQGLADAYIQPAKFLIMQQVAVGASIDDCRRMLKNWNEGELPAGKLATDRHAPRLQAYATQIARDSLFTYQGSIQDVIAQEYQLTKFIYVGGLVKDSRPFCKHLVGLRRKIDIEEIPELVKKYPQGLKPNTTKKNFLQVRGGYNCVHTCMVVR
jgi:hypothetical protein